IPGQARNDSNVDPGMTVSVIPNLIRDSSVGMTGQIEIPGQARNDGNVEPVTTASVIPNLIRDPPLA
ncbi:MAG: hypothetical protein J6S91_09345, partial [Treponema sp.]|nr:hypothetical protein [Treponema sp.]